MADSKGIGALIWLVAPLYSRRAARGAKLMDIKSDPDWYTKIDKDKLDFSSEYNCVIGQVHGNFFAQNERILGSKSGFRHALSAVGNGFAAGWVALAWGWALQFMGEIFEKEPNPPLLRRLKMAWVYQIDRRLEADKAAFAAANGA